jgi:dihydrofolate synthase/folylpolyglutamate synthase
MIPVSDEAIHNGLAAVDWPGRLQMVPTKSGQKILLDGAHNVAGAKALLSALGKNFPAAKLTLILGVLQDKDWPQICRTLAPMASRIFTVPVASERTAAARELAVACRAVNPTAEIAACDSFSEALNCLSVRGIGRADLPVGLDAQQRVPTLAQLVVVTGSLYLVGEALELLGLSPVAGSERALNEWSARPAAAPAV